MLTLESVLYRSVQNFAEFDRENPDEAADILGTLLGTEIERATNHLGDCHVSMNMCVSTMMDFPFASGSLQWSRIRQAAAAVTRFPPQNFSPSYECAGWGFALGYARRHCKPNSIVIVSVVDVNPWDISFWRASDHWGKSGFGISTVVFRVPPDGKFDINIGQSQSSYHMGEFCIELRKWLNSSKSERANVPFLPENMVGIYSQFLDTNRVLPDLHHKFGHCFGSDTWISYIVHSEQGLVVPGLVYTATSASLRGYRAIMDMRVSETATLAFTGEPALVEEMRQ